MLAVHYAMESEILAFASCSDGQRDVPRKDGRHQWFTENSSRQLSSAFGICDNMSDHYTTADDFLYAEDKLWILQDTIARLKSPQPQLNLISYQLEASQRLVGWQAKRELDLFEVRSLLRTQIRECPIFPSTSEASEDFTLLHSAAQSPDQKLHGHDSAGIVTGTTSTYASGRALGEWSNRSTSAVSEPIQTAAYHSTFDFTRHETLTSERQARDMFLVTSKMAGMSYKEIKAQGGFIEPESTLRGRYRTLTKSKEQRVRKPQWLDKDVSHSQSLSTTDVRRPDTPPSFSFYGKQYIK